jgi:anti-sigma factor RsiW
MTAQRAHESSCKECGDLMRVAREMSCADFVDFLDDYVSEALPANQRSVFERHIGICPECVSYLESYRTTIALARAAECDAETDEPCSMPEGLVRAILAARLAADQAGEDRAE